MHLECIFAEMESAQEQLQIAVHTTLLRTTALSEPLAKNELIQS